MTMAKGEKIMLTDTDKVFTNIQYPLTIFKIHKNENSRNFQLDLKDLQ